MVDDDIRARASTGKREETSHAAGGAGDKDGFSVQGFFIHAENCIIARPGKSIVD